MYKNICLQKYVYISKKISKIFAPTVFVILASESKLSEKVAKEMVILQNTMQS